MSLSLLILLGIPTFGLNVVFLSSGGSFILLYRRKRGFSLALIMLSGAGCVFPPLLLSLFLPLDIVGVCVLSGLLVIPCSRLVSVLLKRERYVPEIREEEVEKILERFKTQAAS